MKKQIKHATRFLSATIAVIVGTSAFAERYQDTPSELVEEMNASTTGGTPVAMEYFPTLGKVRIRAERLDRAWSTHAVIRSAFLRTPDGRPGLEARYYANPNCQGEPVKVETVPEVNFNWKHNAPIEGLPPDGYSVRWVGTVHPPTDGEYHFMAAGRTGITAWLDGRRVSWRGHFRGKDGKYQSANLPQSTRKLEGGKAYDLRVEFHRDTTIEGAKSNHPAEPVLKWWARSGEPPTIDRNIQFVLYDAESHALVEHDLNGNVGTAIVEVGDLDNGRYFAAVRTDGEMAALQPLVRRHFPWENTEYGITDKVYAPFNPIQVKDDTVTVVMRKYRFDGLGLWRSVEARSNEGAYKELLAAPIRLVANGSPMEGTGNVTDVNPQSVIYQGQATHPAVNVRTRCTTEYDGCMKVELTLEPGDQQTLGVDAQSEKPETANPEPGTLNSLTLDIPIQDERAPLWHTVVSDIRGNPRGAPPAGQGLVWDSTRQKDRHWHGNFNQYFWFGDEERGLSWFANNEKGWVMDWKNQPPCQTLHRNNGVLTLRVHLVQKPVVLQEPRTITFGLMASPVKPMPKNWRALGRPGGPTRFHFDMPMVHGVPANFSARYPLNKDWSPFDAYFALRKGEDIDIDAFVDEWCERNLTENTDEELRKTMRHFIEQGLKRGRGRPARDPLTTYFEEFFTLHAFADEAPVFGAEWSLQNDKQTLDWQEKMRSWELTHFYHFRWAMGVFPTESYRDFGAYYAAEWLRRGFGTYFDNVFTRVPTRNLLTSDAFRRPDGGVQPSAELWAKREYLKRIWVLHQQIHMPDTPQLMMLHMTNANILPWLGFNQCNLDLEMGMMMGNTPMQERYSPELLRTHSLGLKTGNYPIAMAKAKGADKHKLPELRRQHMGVLLVHEVRQAWSVTTQTLPEPMVDFGYGLEDCDVVNYWDENPPLQIDNPDCKWLLMHRNGEWLVLLCTWNPDPETVTLNLDKTVADLSGMTARDPETGERLSITNNAVEVDMNGYGMRFVQLGEKQ